MTYIARAHDGAFPGTHEDIVHVFDTITDSTVADALLSAFQLLQQSKVTRNCRENDVGVI